MANKKLKTNLHMASLTAIRFDRELKAYYERKVAEGNNRKRPCLSHRKSKAEKARNLFCK